MPTAAKSTYGTLFKQGSTTIAEVTAVGEVGPEAEMIDVTSLDSSSATREFIAGLINSGKIKIDFNFIPGNATQQGLRTNCTSRAAATYSVVFTGSGETFTFSALVESFKANPGEVAGSLKGTAEFQITGVITVT